MKQRIITSVIGLVILAVVVLGFETLLLNVVVSLISLLALMELLKAAGYLRHRSLAAVAGIYAVLFPFFRAFWNMDLLPLVSLLYFLALLCVLLRWHNDISFQEMLTVGAFGILIPASFTNVVLLRNNHGWQGGIFCFLILLGSAWYSDTCAYFTGHAWGKHKLSPVISPHKTVEGLIGGLVGSVLCNLAMASVYSKIVSMMGTPNEIAYGAVALVTLCGSVASVLGDLAASTHKRQPRDHHFGNIMPGHGRIMDRFDSVLLVSPVVYLLSCFIPMFIML